MKSRLLLLLLVPALMAQMPFARPPAFDGGEPEPPPPTTFNFINLGDSSSGSCAEPGGGLNVTGRGTHDELNGGLCYKTTSAAQAEWIVRLDSLTGYEEQWTQGGAIFLDDPTDSTDSYCSMNIPSAGDGTPEPWFKWRTIEDTTIGKTASQAGGDFPEYVAIQLDLNLQQCRSYWSGNGSDWVQADSSPVGGIEFEAPYAYGVFVASRTNAQDTTLATSNYVFNTSFTINPTPPVSTGLPDAPLTTFGALSGEQTLQVPATRTALYRFKSIVASGYWTGAFDFTTLNRDQVVDDIHSGSATQLGTANLIFNYALVESKLKDVNALPGLTTIMGTTNCLARLTWPSGPVVDSFWPGAEQWNTSSFCPAVGDNIGVRIADFLDDHFYDVGGTQGSADDASDSLDGLLRDNLFFQFRTDFDVNMDGLTDSAGSSQMRTALRESWALEYARMKSLNPTKRYGGNSDFWNSPNGDITPLSHVGDLSYVESIYGVSWSPNNWDGAHVPGYISRAIQQATDDAFVMVGATFQELSITMTANDWREVSYHCGLVHIFGGSCALGRDTPGIGAGWVSEEHVLGVWADEFDGGSGIADGPVKDENWLGQRVGTRTECGLVSLDCPKYQNVVFMGEWERGYITCNPRDGNYAARSTPSGPAVTFTLPVNVRRLTGAQNPSQNSGATHNAGTQITNNDGVCLWLEKL